MGELTVRRNKGFAVPRYPETGRAEKPSGAAQAQKTANPTGFTVSGTLQQLMTRAGRAENHIRESRRTLQGGEAVLAEVQDSLDQMADLAQASAGGGADRSALQAKLERLREEIDRMIRSAVAGDAQLFLDGDAGSELEAPPSAVLEEEPAEAEGVRTLPDWLLKGIAGDGLTAEDLLAALGLDRSAGAAELLAAVMSRPLESDPAAGRLAALYLGAVIAGGDFSKAVDLKAAAEGLGRLLETVAEGVPADRAIELLTGGAFTGVSNFQSQFAGGTAPGLQVFLTELLLSGGGDPLLGEVALLGLLSGMEGMKLELLMGLLAAASGSGAAAAEEGAPFAAGEGAPGGMEAAAEPGAAPQVSVMRFGEVAAIGRDLSCVSFDEASGELTVSGSGEVLLQGTGTAEQAVRITGSGTVALQNVNVPVLTVAAPEGRVFCGGEVLLAEVRMEPGTALVLDGSGLTRFGVFRADGSNTLRLLGGAAAAEEGEDGSPGFLPVPVVLEGPAVLAARAVRVSGPKGETLKPFDVVWKTLLPGWSAVTAVETEGRRAKMSLLSGGRSDLVRLWLERGDPSRGYAVHTLALRGRDKFGRPKTRYAYLHWNQGTQAFEETVMYPNPFTVTGGEPGRDWRYEEESHTLRILSGQVTAISGGAGTDANQAPFSGRIALADGIGSVELSLGGVACRVSHGQAFCLGRGNAVTLLLQSGTDNHFEGGKGCAGISLGDGTTLCINRVEPRDGGRTPMGALFAAGGDGGAGIGRDCSGSRDQTSHILIRGGAVTATGTGGGAGIGAGKRSAMGAVTLLGGTVSASGEKGGGAGIGGALGAPVGDISIRGGRVAAAAAGHAAAIGAGVRGACGDILITGTARIVKALGGDPGADIGACLFGSCGKVVVSGGADIGSAKLWMRTGIPLQMGEEAVTLPQFRLSVKALRLDQASVSTQEAARAAKRIIDADRRWVAQIQAAYSALYERLEQNSNGVYSVRQYIGVTKGLMRDTAAASALVEDMSRSIPLQSSQAMRTHTKRGTEDVRQLLWDGPR